MIKKANWLFAAIILVALSSCSMSKNVAKINVKNTTTLERSNEIVEVDWSKVSKKLSLNQGNNIQVTDSEGKAITHQLVTNGNDSPETLIFPVNLNSKEKKTYYVVVTGRTREYDPLVYGRLVPERQDDFAWENNRVAYRVYGPALQATGEISNGLDIWVKRTENLVINKWYKDDLAGKASYHADHGEGLDFYKVGPTLGLGMTAPVYNEKLCLGKNFTQAEVLDNGPLRISFKLHYAPYSVGNNEVTETRIITLDAYNYLNKIEKIFESDNKELYLATGFVLSGKDEQITYSDNYNGIISYQVPTDKNNGTIFTGAINLMGYEKSELANNHFLGYNHFESGKKYTYYTGGGWSKSGFDSFEDWNIYLIKEKEIIKNPLKVKVK